jgi:NTE family protein
LPILAKSIYTCNRAVEESNIFILFFFEISFNAVLIKELRAMALLRRLEQIPDSEGARMAAMRVHRIASPTMNELGYSSKLNAEWAFLTMLRDEGRRTADAFLAEHGDALGYRETTIDFDELLVGI